MMGEVTTDLIPCPYCGERLGDHPAPEAGKQHCRLIGGADGREILGEPMSTIEENYLVKCGVCGKPWVEHDPKAICSRHKPAIVRERDALKEEVKWLRFGQQASDDVIRALEQDLGALKAEVDRLNGELDDKGEALGRMMEGGS